MREITRVLTSGGDETVTAGAIRVGDVLHLHKDERVPADGLLLHCSDETGTVFVRTDQLDGETDWKVKEAVRFTQRLADRSPPTLLDSAWSIVAEPPSDSIYTFGGNFHGPGQVYEPLRAEHMVWANSVVASGSVYLLVVYTGVETRMALNSKRPRQKFGRTDHEMNRLFKATFGILVVVSVAMFLVSGYEFCLRCWVEVVRIFSILSTLLPFMLKLNTDFAKLFYAAQINADPDIPGTIVRNRQIPEELGRVEFLLSDKTGTLTRNEMVFKELRTVGGTFGRESFNRLREKLSDAYLRGGFMESAEETALKTTLLGLLLCNNVSPTVDDGQRTLQASSPDEIALVNFAESLGFFMESRRANSIRIRNPSGQIESYEVLENFPFSSERMRMGILLRNADTDQLLFFLKGADAAIQPKLKSDEGIFAQEQCEGLSADGLRTLVLTHRAVDPREYLEWKAEFKRASANLSQRNELEKAVVEQLERGVSFLAVTGVEDLLQEDIKVSITTLRNAGIRVWMLTGDKLETAKCIAISTGFKAPSQRFFEAGDPSSEAVAQALDRYDPETSVMVISGAVLAVVLANPNFRRPFFAKALRAKSVVFCRCAPKQKAQIALILKETFGKVVCGIGDGGNDVGMIQSASVGVGVEGKEGLQASLASDFSVRQFKAVVPLFLWHGRLSYLRTATLALLVIHRGFIQTTIQYVFMSGLYFVTMNFYNGWLMTFYGSVFTNLVVLSVVLDQDLPRRQAFNYPQLYRDVQNGGLLRPKWFLAWVAKAVYQGAAIMLLCLFVFRDSFVHVGTISFTALILVEYLTVALVLKTWHRAMGLALLLSFLSYAFCLLFLRSPFGLSALSPQDLAAVAALVAASWLPVLVGRLVQRLAFPTPAEKVVAEARLQERRKTFIRDLA